MPAGLTGVDPLPIRLATDGSKEAGMAAKVAADIALRGGVPLHLVHAWTEVGPMNYLPSPMAAIETGYEADAVVGQRVAPGAPRWPGRCRGLPGAGAS